MVKKKSSTGKKTALTVGGLALAGGLAFLLFSKGEEGESVFENFAGAGTNVRDSLQDLGGAFENLTGIAEAGTSFLEQATGGFRLLFDEDFRTETTLNNLYTSKLTFSEVLPENFTQDKLIEGRQRASVGGVGILDFLKDRTFAEAQASKQGGALINGVGLDLDAVNTSFFASQGSNFAGIRDSGTREQAGVNLASQIDLSKGTSTSRVTNVFPSQSKSSRRSSGSGGSKTISNSNDIVITTDRLGQKQSSIRSSLLPKSNLSIFGL